MKLPQDGNDYGKEKVILLMKRIQYYKQHKYRYKSKDNDLSEIVLTSSDLTANCTPTKNISDNEKQKYRIPLSEVSKRQKYRRTEEISNVIVSEAEKQQVTTNELMGVVIHQINYKADKNAADCGTQLQSNSKNYNKLPLSAASYIQLYNNMGRTAYQRQINTLKM